MFRSIRWRLVASFVLIAIVAVSLVSVLALTLLERSIELQAKESMQANGEAVALRAQGMIWPVLKSAALQDLAETATYLGNDHVRIYDRQGRLLADSTSDGALDAFVWMLPLGEFPFGTEAAGSVIVSLSTLKPFLEGWFQGDLSIFEMLPPDTEMTLVRRVNSPWGSHLIFESSPLLTSTPQIELTENVKSRTETLRSRIEYFERLARNAEPDSLAEVDSRVVSVAIGEPTATLGYVEIYRDISSSMRALDTVRQVLFVAGAGAVLFSFVLGLFVSGRLTAPLQDLAQTASQMTDTDLSPRAPIQGGAEIEQLARQFNDMADRLEASFAVLAAERDALRRFVADTSHELRTPITALKSFNELLQGPAADDPAARKEFLAESQAQLDRLEGITHHLLDLSRIDAGLIELDRSAVDIGELLIATASFFEAQYKKKQITLLVEAPDPAISVSGDRQRLQISLSNLIDNAVKFTPEGGWIRLGADERNHIVNIWVVDTGPGITAEDRAHIFDRFYSSAGGTGLGLAIAYSNIRAHGGTIRVEDEQGGGSKFVIVLPQSG